MDTQSLAPNLSNFNSPTHVENSTQADVPAALNQASAAIRVAQRVVEAYEVNGDKEGAAYARNILEQWQAREQALQARLEASRQVLTGKPEKITLIRRVVCNSCKAKLSPSATTCPHGCTGGLSISYHNPAYIPSKVEGYDQAENLSRRQFLAGLAGAAAIAATAALPALPAQAAAAEPTPPVHPVGRDFQSPAELEAYLAQLDAYLPAVAARVASQDVETIAADIMARVHELAAICQALAKDDPEKGEAVMDALHLGKDTAYSTACVSNDFIRYPKMADYDFIRAHCFGLDFFPVSQQGEDFYSNKYYLLESVGYRIELR